MLSHSALIFREACTKVEHSQERWCMLSHSVGVK